MAEQRRGILSGELAGQTLIDGVHVLPGQGNSLAIETDAGPMYEKELTQRKSAERDSNSGDAP